MLPAPTGSTTSFLIGESLQYYYTTQCIALHNQCTLHLVVHQTITCPHSLTYARSHSRSRSRTRTCTRSLARSHRSPANTRYWYNETSSFGPKGLFQDGALEEGFLKAPNRAKMDFALMWASQEWMDVHPAVGPSIGCVVLFEGAAADSTTCCSPVVGDVQASLPSSVICNVRGNTEQRPKKELSSELHPCCSRLN